MQENGWSLVLDPEVAHPDREEAWDELCLWVRRPVIEYLRRNLRGFREPERVADDLLEEVQIEYEGSGEQELRLRACIAAALRKLELEHAVDEEFDRDWASSLLRAALQEMKGALPRTYALLLRLYDSPEGDEAKLAAKLEMPLEDVHDQLVEGRAELQQRFLDEVRKTVADPEMAAAEAAHLLVYTRKMF
ncbi:MAG: hypothetical protein AAGD14_03500 [Planctomycetota bacterium]